MYQHPTSGTHRQAEPDPPPEGLPDALGRPHRPPIALTNKSPRPPRQRPTEGGRDTPRCPALLIRAYGLPVILAPGVILRRSRSIARGPHYIQRLEPTSQSSIGHHRSPREQVLYGRQRQAWLFPPPELLLGRRSMGSPPNSMESSASVVSIKSSMSAIINSASMRNSSLFFPLVATPSYC